MEVSLVATAAAGLGGGAEGLRGGARRCLMQFCNRTEHKIMVFLPS